ncbi:hypothetical protein BOTBODRAFT_598775 [Botryobasidium botryosum FD-172 SS1]|uniref:G domain-containing protein n=1 Tax=Botryobasidium botryosum (strain FD-172 SS1) TaxID=930990 RepID=A0A067MZ21_BOTB1|nr:hypothetical protein BOTBODRAFT_598775 [Botryobasidium botryosum FD-172 SS1]
MSDNRYRILVLGRCGVGKTSLIKEAFNVEKLEPSKYLPGVCKITDEIVPDADDRFVLHDSQGFEPGESANFKVVRAFVDERAKKRDVKDQIHAIWLCIQVPFAGSRVFERSDEMILEFEHKIPVIVIFTQYDRLYDYVKFNMEAATFRGKDEKQIRAIVDVEAEASFKELCSQPLIDYNPHQKWTRVSTMPQYKSAIPELVATTNELLAKHLPNYRCSPRRR